MTESMELDLSLKQPVSQTLETSIVPPIKLKEDNNTAKIPKEYTIENYYGDDQLGSDVLKQ